MSKNFHTRREIILCHPEFCLMSVFVTLDARLWQNTEPICSKERISVMAMAGRNIQWFVQIFHYWYSVCHLGDIFEEFLTFWNCKIFNNIEKSIWCHYSYFCWMVSKSKSVVETFLLVSLGETYTKLKGYDLKTWYCFVFFFRNEKMAKISNGFYS